ncbi:hypothetical protein MMC09_003580 [Bachmanniomyces sp. S44760]|nr:hypothetical protein [Bachmanniomyces sp. S44760]
MSSHYTDTTTSASNGETGGHIPQSIPIYMAIAAFTAVAWYNVIELNIQVFMTFKRHRGLYFWSLIISSYGCVLHALGFLLKFFQLTTNNYLSVTIITIGWYCMVTGQAIVLYSRLHLVVRNYKVLRAVLIMIIVDAICFHIPTTILTYGSNSNTSEQYTTAFNAVERLQMTAFCIQEFIISGVYVWATLKLLKPVYHGRTRNVMMQLIWINCIIIGMDVVLLVMEYGGNYEIEATLKAMVYSIKLKLEFAVLNQLMTLANSSVNNATKLTVDDNSYPEPKSGAHRSKSLSYIGKGVSYPERSLSKKTTKSQPAQRSPRSDFASGRSVSFTSQGSNKPGLKWGIPSLDRHHAVETHHLEDAKGPHHNVFTNPAAYFHPKTSNRFPPHDDLGCVATSPTSPLSPTLSGSTLEHQGTNPFDPSPNRKSAFPRDTSHLASSYGNLSTSLLHPRAGNQDDSDHRESDAPFGILRSTRPSVTDWAEDAESDTGIPQLPPPPSPAPPRAEEREMTKPDPLRAGTKARERLERMTNQMEKANHQSRTREVTVLSGDIESQKERAEQSERDNRRAHGHGTMADGQRNIGLDFMTSALHD